MIHIDRKIEAPGVSLERVKTLDCVRVVLQR